ncbi:MAG: hypothetical protein H5T70_12090, partial [Chloroflexi bacterium]|nr:hypothetical protein [Chloroflexota bacterium]
MAERAIVERLKTGNALQALREATARIVEGAEPFPSIGSLSPTALLGYPALGGVDVQALPPRFLEHLRRR